MFELIRKTDITYRERMHVIHLCTPGKPVISTMPLSFDIETTNDDETRTAYMYIWQFAVKDSVYIGRTWDDFRAFLDFLAAYIPNGIKLVYIHNMSFEMSFLLPRLDMWGLLENVNAKDPRHLLSVKLNNGIEFRDSMLLTNTSLAHLAKQYTQTQKMTGDLDYKKPRNSTTKLYDGELLYCINDVLILSEYAEYLHAEYTRKRKKIPLTSTGIVRQHVKRAAGAFRCPAMFPATKERYNLEMRYLFRGGYTHANTARCNQIIKNVSSYDLTSAYPAVMLNRQFPSEPFKTATPSEVDGVLTSGRFAWFAVFTLTDIRAKTPHVYESRHKIIDGTALNAIYENGRLYSADRIAVMLTDIDFEIYRRFYTFTIANVEHLQYSRYALLPWFLRRSVIEFYEGKKQKKKEVKAFRGTFEERAQKEKELLNIKGKLNSLYGMCVTRLQFDKWVYEGGTWAIQQNKVDYEKECLKSFLSPYWGIWVTAHVRNIITSAMVATGNDGIYSDTDSVKFSGNYDNYFNRYNENCVAENKRLYPKNADVWDIGTFDYEGTYTAFKTLGAKRYVYVDAEHQRHLTVAGLPKSIVNNYENAAQLFRAFTDNMYIEMCKNCAIYTDEETESVIDGELMHEYGCCYIGEIGFKMSIDDLFLMQMTERRKDIK